MFTVSLQTSDFANISQEVTDTAMISTGQDTHHITTIHVHAKQTDFWDQQNSTLACCPIITNFITYYHQHYQLNNFDHNNYTIISERTPKKQLVPIRATMAWRKTLETPSPTTVCANDLFSPRYVLICRRRLDTYKCQHKPVTACFIVYLHCKPVMTMMMKRVCCKSIKPKHFCISLLSPVTSGTH